MKYWFILLIVICSPKFVLSQNLSGTVSVQGKQQTPTVTVVLKDTTQTNIGQQYKIVRDGHYSFDLKNKYHQLSVTVTAYGYYESTKHIENPSEKEIIKADFKLIPKEIQELNEVKITAQRKYKRKKDTVSYNLKAYSDGTERKIEEVLEKLPGVDVSDDGSIKYNGKLIETVTIEEDNLFGHNYTVGTKNINAEAIKAVEAIKNYTKNPLLKDVVKSDKVALNLKVKEGKFDLSGNFDIKSGLRHNNKAANDLNFNVLNISNNYKSFSTASYNNVGKNRSSFNYFNYSRNIEDLKDKNYYAPKIIPEFKFRVSQIKQERAKFNNQSFINYNSAFNLLDEHLKIRVNLYLLNDEIHNFQNNKNEYFLNQTHFTTVDETRLKKNPEQYRGDVNVKYKINANSAVNYSLRLSKENIKTNWRTKKNRDSIFKANLKTKDIYVKQSLQYTQKLDNSNVFQFHLFQSTNDLPQKLRLKPNPFGNRNIVYQNSEFKKKHYEAKASFLGKTGNDRYKISGLATRDNTSLHSIQKTQDETRQNLNNFDLNHKSIELFGSYNLKLGKLSFKPHGRISQEDRTVDYTNSSKNLNQLIINTGVNLWLDINSNSKIRAGYSYQKQPNSAKYLFKRPIIRSLRTMVSNEPKLAYYTKNSYFLNYFKNDLFNQFELKLSLNYNTVNGNYYAREIIDPAIIGYEYFFLTDDRENFQTHFDIKKYISPLLSTFKVLSDYSSSYNKNIVNNSELRYNRNEFFKMGLNWKSSFPLPVNFKNKFSYNFFQVSTENGNSSKNETLYNEFKVIGKPAKEWFFIVSSQISIPDLDAKKRTYHFVDSNIKFKPENKNFELGITAKNIFNERNFFQIQSTNSSRNIFQTDLLGRYFLLSMSYSF